MATLTGAKVVRIQNLPVETSIEDLKELLLHTCNNDERSIIEIEVNFVPSCTVRDGSRAALVKINPALPAVFGDLNKTDYQIETSGSILNVDKNFYGLTQLYPTVDSRSISADIVAVTGLNGRPYDSWRGKGPHGSMWLRDFFCLDLPSYRTMIYGYNTKWHSKSISNLNDMGHEFLNELQKARRSEEEVKRPLILLAHSLGAIVIALATIDCKLAEPHSFRRHTFRAIQGILFFGAPYHGMHVDDIAEMATELSAEHRMHIVDYLRKGSVKLQTDMSGFKTLTGEFPIVSFYETVMSQALEKAEASEKGYARIGKHLEYVPRNSAILNLPEHLEQRILVDSDHSNMVKFDHRSDRTYQNILRCIHHIEHFWGESQEHRVESMRAESRSARGDKEIVETRLWPDRYSHTDATPTIKPPGDITLDALPVPTMHYALVEVMRLYKRLDFGSFTEHNGTFAVLRIELPFLFDKAKRYSDLLHGQLEQCPRTMTNMTFEEIKKLLERYILTVHTSVLAFQKLIGPRPALAVASKIDETLSVLTSCVASISQLNSEAAMAVSSGVDYLFKTPSLTNQREPQAQALVDMHCSRVVGPREGMDRLWVNSRHLILGDFPEPRPRIASESYLQRLINLWASNKSEKMKLSPRQYGILQQGDQLEDIMAEFRPYPKNLKNNSEDEYRSRRLNVCLLARMMLSTQDAELRVSFPCVKFRCLSEIVNPDNPGFVLVYSSRGISSLGEEIQKSQECGKTPPSKRVRQLMALNLAKAILALHLSHQVHGRINPENIFFDFSNADDSASEQETLSTPLLAGFEVSRDVGGQSDYLDEEDSSQRVYLHPDRHPMGSQKSNQRRPHDIFSLGLVLIEIGLWTRFHYMRKYQESSNDQERQAFAVKLYKAFSCKRMGREGNMGRIYHTIVRYCLAGEKDRPQLGLEDLPEPDTILLGEPNGMQLVALLEKQLREDNGESGA